MDEKNDFNESDQCFNENVIRIAKILTFFRAFEKLEASEITATENSSTLNDLIKNVQTVDGNSDAVRGFEFQTRNGSTSRRNSFNKFCQKNKCQSSSVKRERTH